MLAMPPQHAAILCFVSAPPPVTVPKVSGAKLLCVAPAAALSREPAKPGEKAFPLCRIALSRMLVLRSSLCVPMFFPWPEASEELQPVLPC